MEPRTFLEHHRRPRTPWGRCGSLLRHRVGLAPLPVSRRTADTTKYRRVLATPEDNVQNLSHFQDWRLLLE